ncbi:probable inactive poly [ADP-ribose] polymerase SRO2 isoform X2 [Jatropha curcas]|uniref:probable inactive poly [ADP-ribose] polymerase SRO2 isoform X2 n=1 Tax=Jatropha curcas TaxID=180498 RepID=UPI0005FAD194|nr:probable inactive poly [ADP-ribose] polymerase SRO2 isoform X2 [Jatropha curcas]
MLTNQYLEKTPHQIPIFQGEQVDIEDKGSVVIDNNNDDKILDSDADNSVANSGYSDSSFGDFTRNGMLKVGEGSLEHNTITRSFLEGMRNRGKDTKIVAIHKNSASGSAGRARWLTFRIFTEAVSQKSGGDANLRFGWFGGSREKICQVISHGFSLCSETANGESHGFGISLSPPKFCIDSAASATVDENGLRHMLLCRVVMGKMEVIPAGSKQFQPSSTEFDSGVDNLEEPRKFIVWSAFMNSHIFPAYIISFQAPCFNGLNTNLGRSVRPSSPWMSFPALLSILSRFLEPSKMALIFKFYDDFRKNKISRLTLIRKVRQISGDRLLAAIIRNCTNKLVIGRSNRGRKY